MITETFNKWLTLLANLGVVIGLILLIVELDQNSELMEAQINQMRADATVQKWAGWADSEYLAPLITKLLEAGFPAHLVPPEQLTPVEVTRLGQYLTATIVDYDNLYYQYQNGHLDQSYWDDRIVPSIKLLAPYWKVYSPATGRAAFHAEVDRILRESE